jgi:tetratricopeptide (TPR) repeat protein
VKKWLMYAALVILMGGSWMLFFKSGREINAIHAQVAEYHEQGDPDGKIPKLEGTIQTLEGQRTFNGILLALFSASLVGLVFVLQILPSFAQRLTHAVYDSAEMLERDVMHDARSLLAQGDYQGAIEAFRQAAAADPLNRLPWVEITKIYKDNLDDPAAAVQTIRYALESQEWEISDAAYFLFRLAELYDEVYHNRAAAIGIMQQVIAEFPGTRHSANATHKLHAWSMEGAGKVEGPTVQRPGATV